MNIIKKKELQGSKNKIRFVIFDFDGVFTDGKIFFDNEGNPVKHYNAKDGMGIFQLHNNGIQVGVISGWKENPSQMAILKHLKIQYISLGSNDKLTILKKWCHELNIPLENVAYMGDDSNDLEIMKDVGFVACPKDAISDVKNISHFVSTRSGGNGAIRQFCDFITENEQHLCFCIPARMNSTRLPGKLLLPIGEKSCIQHTITNVQNSKYFNDNIIVLTDDVKIKNELKDYPCKVIITTGEYQNGTERISKNLEKIDKLYQEIKYNVIVNIQADEPFISSKNIDFCIEKHYEKIDSNIFYTTLHEETNSKEYLESTASLKVLTDNQANVLYYSRNLIPFNKQGKFNENLIYKTFTGIYIFDRKMLELYPQLPNGKLQIEEDCEQLKILEAGYKIKSYSTVEYNEISLNTMEDYNFLLNKYHTNNMKNAPDENGELIHLDCTLRDGGYNNNWRFHNSFVKNYVEIIDKIKVDYVEIGFINILKEYKGEIVGRCRNIDEEFISLFKNKNFKICAMGDFKNIDIDFLKKKVNLDLIRVAFHKMDYKEAILQCQDIINLGYKVSANVMGITNYTKQDILDLIQLINKTSIEFVCVADSFGSLQNFELEIILNLFEKNLESSTLGVHLHNNMQNAYTNYEYIRSNYKKKCIIDSTLFGMGRGAGNLQTELVYANKIKNDDFCELLIFIENFIKNFMTNKSCTWGYDLDYLYAGLHGIHPNYVVKMREKNICFTNILFLLKEILTDKKHQYFDLNYFQIILQKYLEDLI